MRSHLASPESTAHVTRWVRPQDAVLLVLFAAVASVSPTRDASEVALLAVLAGLQIAGPRIPALGTRYGKILWIVLQLTVAYLLVGYTQGLNSNYFLILLLPVISAATNFGVVGTLVFTLLTCGSYISFLAFVDFSRFIIEPYEIRVLVMRLIFLAMAGNLVNVLAEALRVQSAKYRKAAEDLA